MAHITKIFTYILIAVMTTACGPRSMDEFREEGEGISRTLLKELKAIHTREELADHLFDLAYRFNQLVDLMIEAHEWRRQHGGDLPELTGDDHRLSDELRAELNRLCRLDGGRELIEKCQDEPLNRLDAYLKASKSSSK